MSDGGVYADWVADNETDLMREFIEDDGKNVNLYMVSALLAHYEGLEPKPKTLEDLVDALINKDKDLEGLYLKYIESRWADLNDKSMALYDRADYQHGEDR